MNKRIAVLISVIAMLFVATLCYSQVAREPAYPELSGSAGQTNYTNIGVSGLNQTGNPGYIMLRGVGPSAWGGAGTDATSNYVLWVDDIGRLCLASYTTISSFASFPSGNWNSTSGPGITGGFKACTAVGGQS